MSLKDFEIVSKLGQGTYSTVYKAIRREDNKLYAIKRVKIFSLSPKQRENALNEIRILASIRHLNIIGYKQAFTDQSTKSLCIVMQFANYGDLAYRIAEKQKKGQQFTETEIWDFFIQIVQGLDELHRRNIFHRDIKSANIFLNNEENQIQAKLGDMNVSKISEKGLCMTQTGTPYYASPQVWKDLPYDSKSDIWSLGCVLYEIITLKPPFRAEDMEGLFKKVTRGIYPRIPNKYSSQLSSMIRSLLQVAPESRPSCQKILKNSFVLKKMKELHQSQNHLQNQLMRTIRPGQNFVQLQQSLPKPNYLPLKSKKDDRSQLATIDEGIVGMVQVQSLPALEKQKKKLSENSDRIYLKNNKKTISVSNKDRKKSEMAIDKSYKIIGDGSIIGKSTSQHVDPKDLKLPRVYNRNNKPKQRIKKQKSLRNHKLY